MSELTEQRAVLESKLMLDWMIAGLVLVIIGLIFEMILFVTLDRRIMFVAGVSVVGSSACYLRAQHYRRRVRKFIGN